MPAKKEGPSVRPTEKPRTVSREQRGLLTRFREQARTHGYAVALLAGLYATEATSHTPGHQLIESSSTTQAPDIQEDARTVHVDYTHGNTEQEPVRETIPGDRIETEGDMRFLWGEHDFHRVDAERAEQAVLRTQIRQVLDRYLSELEQQHLSPERILSRIGVTVEAYSSPEGWRHADRNQTLSEQRAQFAETIIRDELKQRGLDALPVFVRSEGKGAEGDLLEFSTRVRQEFRHATGHSVEQRRDFAERVVAAIHDGNAHALYRILPQAHGHLPQLNAIYQETVANHRHAHVKFVFETKDVSFIHAPTEPPPNIPSRTPENAPQVTMVEYIDVPILDPAIIREEQSEEAGESSRVVQFPTKEPPREQPRAEDEDAPILTWESQESEDLYEPGPFHSEASLAEIRRLENQILELSTLLTRFYALGHGDSSRAKTTLQELADTKELLETLRPSKKRKLPNPEPPASNQPAVADQLIPKPAYTWDAPPEIAAHLHTTPQPYRKTIGAKGAGFHSAGYAGRV